jgi:hypothetical protein
VGRLQVPLGLRAHHRVVRHLWGIDKHFCGDTGVEAGCGDDPAEDFEAEDDI